MSECLFIGNTVTSVKCLEKCLLCPCLGLIYCNPQEVRAHCVSDLPEQLSMTTSRFRDDVGVALAQYQNHSPRRNIKKEVQPPNTNQPPVVLGISCSCFRSHDLVRRNVLCRHEKATHCTCDSCLLFLYSISSVVGTCKWY